MTEQENRELGLKQLANLRKHIEAVEEKRRWAPAVAECLADAWFAIEKAGREYQVDWDVRLRRWEQGKPKGKEALC